MRRTFQVFTRKDQNKEDVRVLLKIAVPKNMTKSLKNSSERAAFLVKLEARGDRISVPTFAFLLALQANER